MRLCHLTATNVFSLGHVNLSLESRGLLLITGYSEDEGSANGAGKSSLANKALLWGLYGRTAGGLKADDVINCRNKKAPASVEIKFKSDLGLDYYITRSRNPNKLTLFSSKDGDLTKKTEADTQDIINLLIGKDFETFIQTDFFGQGRTASYVSLRPADQKEVLEAILPIARLNDWADRTKSELALASNAIQKMNGDLRENRGKLEVLISTELQMNSLSANFMQEQGIKIKALRSEAVLIAEKAREKDEEIQRLTALLPVESPEELDALQAKLATANSRKDIATKSYIQAVESHSSWKNEISRLKNRIILSVCDKCGQPLPSEAEELAIERNKEIEESITKAEENLSKAESAKEYYSAERVSFQGLYDECNQRINAITVSERNTRAIQARLLLLQEYDHGQTLSGIQSQIDVEGNRSDPYAEPAKSAKEQREAEEAAIKDREDTLKAFEAQAEALRFWEKAYSKDLKIHLFESVCPFLQERTGYHLTKLGNGQIKTKFSTFKRLKSGDIKEDFNVSVMSDTGGASFDMLSGGEQQMVNFAVSLALSDLASSQSKGRSNLLILDEPFTSLDSRNCENLVNYLSVLNKETVLLISNDDNLMGLIPDREHVIKRNGISNLEDTK